jgi:predicted Na+-dependent transporter
MIEFGVSFVEFVLATFVPIYAGMFLLIALNNVARVDTRYLSGYALGVLFWFFFDTLNDAAQLDVNQGYTFDFNHIGLVTLFIIGFLMFTLLGGMLSSRDGSPAAASKRDPFHLS